MVFDFDLLLYDGLHCLVMQKYDGLTLLMDSKKV